LPIFAPLVRTLYTAKKRCALWVEKRWQNRKNQIEIGKDIISDLRQQNRGRPKDSRKQSFLTRQFAVDAGSDDSIGASD
jgi:hypothetical protein